MDNRDPFGGSVQEDSYPDQTTKSLIKIMERWYGIMGHKEGYVIANMLQTVDRHCRLDFEKLLGFDDFNFVHDISGMLENAAYPSGKLQNHFLPRCSKSSVGVPPASDQPQAEDV